jgi:hypothetical protein
MTGLGKLACLLGALTVSACTPAIPGEPRRPDTEVDKARRSDIVITGSVVETRVDELKMSTRLKSALATQREIVVWAFGSAGKHPAGALIVDKSYHMLRYRIKVHEVIRGTCQPGEVLTVDVALVPDRRLVMKDGKVKTTNTRKFLFKKRTELVCLMKPKNGLNCRPVMAGVADSVTEDQLRNQTERVRRALGAVARTSYHETLRQSEIVAIGAVESTSTTKVELQKTLGGKESTLASAEYLRSRIGKAGQLFACRAQFTIDFLLRGSVKKEISLQVNLAYARSEKGIADFVKSARGKAAMAPDARVVVHLARAPGATDKHPVYELVTEPWPIKKSQLRSKSREMMIRMTRYAAFLRIDMMINNFDTLTEDDLAELARLAAGKGANMGTVENLPIEQRLLGAALSSKGKSKDAVTAWLTWWKANRLGFVGKPFRIIAGRSKSKPKTGKK